MSNEFPKLTFLMGISRIKFPMSGETSFICQSFKKFFGCEKATYYENSFLLTFGVIRVLPVCQNVTNTSFVRQMSIYTYANCTLLLFCCSYQKNKYSLLDI